jgi:hypothetical protein
MGEMITRAQRQLTEANIERIASTYNTWRSREQHGEYEDVAGFSRAASREEIVANGYVLTPGRYVGVVKAEADDEPIDEKIARLKSELYAEFERGRELEAEIRTRLEALQ